MSLVVVCICAFSSNYFCLDRLGKAVILLILFVLSSVGASVAPIMWLCIPARTRLDTFSQQFSKFFKNICTALLQVAVHSTMVSLTSARDCPMPYGNSIVVASSGNAIFPCCAIWQRHACNAFGIAISIVMQQPVLSSASCCCLARHDRRQAPSTRTLEVPRCVETCLVLLAVRAQAAYAVGSSQTRVLLAHLNQQASVCAFTVAHSLLNLTCTGCTWFSFTSSL